MTGAFVCAALSIVPTVRHADYLAPGSKSCAKTNRAIIRAASAASKADYLLPSATARPRRKAAEPALARNRAHPSPAHPADSARPERKRAERGFLTVYQGRENGSCPPVPESPS